MEIRRQNPGYAQPVPSAVSGQFSVMSVIEPVRKPEGWLRSHEGSSVASLVACHGGGPQSPRLLALCLRCSGPTTVSRTIPKLLREMLASHGLIPLVIVYASQYLSLYRHPPGHPLDEGLVKSYEYEYR
eukprot:scaffold356792_cov35-Prasinocladus_malaysianus.AAC.1